MLVLQHRQVRLFLLLLIGLFGLSAGLFASQLAGYLLQPPTTRTIALNSPQDRANPRLKKVDTGQIVSGNIFEPAARGQSRAIPQQASDESQATVTAGGNLKLLGTIEGGDKPLAVIESGGATKTYRLGDNVPGGGELLEVLRNTVTLRQPDGRKASLTIAKPELQASAEEPETVPDDTGGGTSIRSIGENRWEIARDEVEKARNNLNELLKSARMEPNIVNGQTEGFVVKMVRPRSLLAELGIRRGDTITRVNGLELNSPEKALQIFQQLREARRLTVDLKRGNDNLTFDYEVN